VVIDPLAKEGDEQTFSMKAAEDEKGGKEILERIQKAAEENEIAGLNLKNTADGRIIFSGKDFIKENDKALPTLTEKLPEMENEQAKASFKNIMQVGAEHNPDDKKHEPNMLGDNMFGLMSGVGGFLAMLMMGIDPLFAIIGALLMAVVGNMFDDKEHSVMGGLLGGRGKDEPKKENDISQKVDAPGAAVSQSTPEAGKASALSAEEKNAMLKDKKLNQAEMQKLLAAANNKDAALGVVANQLVDTGIDRRVVLMPEGKEGNPGPVIYARLGAGDQIVDVQVAIGDKFVGVDGTFDPKNSGHLKDILAAARDKNAKELSAGDSKVLVDDIQKLLATQFTPQSTPAQEPGAATGQNK
jgi:hypothetical protein